jgi:hypothetical protein
LRRELIQFTPLLFAACIWGGRSIPTTVTTPFGDRASNAQEEFGSTQIQPEGASAVLLLVSAPATHVCGEKGDFDTLRHSSGTLKGEILLWQTTTESMDLHGFWRVWA